MTLMSRYILGAGIEVAGSYLYAAYFYSLLGEYWGEKRGLYRQHTLRRRHTLVFLQIASGHTVC